VGAAAVMAPAYLASKQVWPLDQDIVNWGVATPLFWMEPGPAPEWGQFSSDSLVKSWEMASDQSRITFTLRDDVQFNNWNSAWGDPKVTAADVAYSMNDNISATSIAKQAAAYRLWQDHWEVVNDYTVAVVFKSGERPPSGWQANFSNGDNSPGSYVFSKKVYDALGEEAANMTPVSAGQFRVVKWTANEECVLEAVEDHWMKTPLVQQVQIREIPEVSTRIAAFETGQVDMASIPDKFLNDVLVKTGGSALQVSLGENKVVYFAGNYWQTWNNLLGEAVPARAGSTPGDQYPWIGDPGDADQMERARKVRWAMSLAIDREIINEKIFDGLGLLDYSLLDFKAGDGYWKDEWAEVFDVARATQLLQESGYSTFSGQAYVPPDMPAKIPPEMGEAVIQMWRDNLGLNISILNTAYAARRPSMVDRSQNLPWLWTVSPPVAPDRPWGGTIAGGGAGWNPGVESQVVDEQYSKARKETDFSKIAGMNAISNEDLTHWMTASMIIKVPVRVAIQSSVEWTPWAFVAAEVGAFDTVKLK